MDRFCETPALADVIGLPVYIVDHVIRRDIGCGMASIINCRTSTSGVVIPQCEIVISVANIVQIGKSGCDFALEMYRRQQMAQMREMIGARH